MRLAMAAWLTLAFLLVALSVGWANDREEAILTVQVTSADHEVLEGYFSLGDSATVVAKPGTELHRFLSRQRGRTIKITLMETDGRELSSLQR